MSTVHQLNGHFRAPGFMPSYTANLRRDRQVTAAAIERLAEELATLPDTAAARTARLSISIKQTKMIEKMRRINYALSQSPSTSTGKAA